jgi:hypothetical protein
MLDYLERFERADAIVSKDGTKKWWSHRLGRYVTETETNDRETEALQPRRRRLVDYP